MAGADVQAGGQPPENGLRDGAVVRLAPAGQAEDDLLPRNQVVPGEKGVPVQENSRAPRRVSGQGHGAEPVSPPYVLPGVLIGLIRRPADEGRIGHPRLAPEGEIDLHPPGHVEPGVPQAGAARGGGRHPHPGPAVSQRLQPGHVVAVLVGQEDPLRRPPQRLQPLQRPPGVVGVDDHRAPRLPQQIAVALRQRLRPPLQTQHGSELHAVLGQNLLALLIGGEIQHVGGADADFEGLLHVPHQIHVAQGVPQGDAPVLEAGQLLRLDPEGGEEQAVILLQICHSSFPFYPAA